ncbi:MAG TPA: hypothetical protein DCZ92_02055 [Elusimicrobia bacterium]|nr:hypothetical protein [Elusimicrobiota bacterium]
MSSFPEKRAKSRRRPAPAKAGVPERPRALIVGISRDLHDNGRVLPLAGGFLKAYADKKLGGKFEIRTLNVFNFDSDQVLDQVASWDPEIVAFSCYLWNSRNVETLCRSIRKKYPRKRIILGGPEASGRKAEMLERFEADALVIGEGEASFADLLSRYLAGRSWKSTPGTLVRSGGAVHAGPPRPVIPDLDSIPSPFLDAASTIGGQKGGFYTFETMRGCPNKCSYCVWTDLNAKKLRYFSDKRIASDLCRITENRPTCVFIADSDMFLNQARALRLAPFFRAVATRRKGYYFVFQTNLNLWSGKLMRAWNHENFDMNIGVNSVNPAVQKILGRCYPKSLVEKQLALMRRVAPRTRITMQFMFAAPGETFAKFCESFDWAWRQPITFMLFFHTQPLYGTVMRERAEELGIKCRSVPPYHIISTKECTAAEIKTEGLMILIAAVWMALPQSRGLYVKIADTYFGGSLSAAFLDIWEKLDAATRRLSLRTWDRFNGGSDWFPDDFQLDLMYGYAPPKTKPFIKAAYAALSAAHARLSGVRGEAKPGRPAPGSGANR